MNIVLLTSILINNSLFITTYSTTYILLNLLLYKQQFIN